MTPYYRDALVTIYNADCRAVLPELAQVDCVITDPVWPNALPSLAGGDRPQALFAEAAAHFPRLAKRLVVHLGCDSDPRFLLAVPPELPFLRACWLEYAVPQCKGTILYGSDVAYAFGEAPPLAGSVLPGRITSGRVDFRSPPGAKKWNSKQMTRKGRERPHPCPRRLEHLRWLVRWFAHGAVLDPFCGIGTTLVAAKYAGLPAVGVEVEERYCEVAARRLGQSVIPFPPADEVV